MEHADGYVNGLRIDCLQIVLRVMANGLNFIGELFSEIDLFNNFAVLLRLTHWLGAIDLIGVGMLLLHKVAAK